MLAFLQVNIWSIFFQCWKVAHYITLICCCSGQLRHISEPIVAPQVQQGSPPLNYTVCAVLAVTYLINVDL